MNDTKVGISPPETATRDAIHMAVAPVVSSGNYRSGEHVGLLPDGRISILADKKIGIIDPFLVDGVRTDERCWLFLYPQTVTGMRHHWSHPAFEAAAQTAPSKAESEAWLRNWIRNADCPDYETVVAAAIGAKIRPIDDDYGSEPYKIEDYGDGPRLFFSGRDAHSDIPPEFWDHVENVTGAKVPCRAVGFSCSC